MKKMSSTTAMIGLAALVFVLLIGAAVYKNNAPSKYTEFAQCLTDKGVKMYGAYWCSHCATQKELFGSSFKKIDYIECSSPGSKTFDLCPDIQSTPTWQGPDGAREVGERSLEELSDLYDCPLPE